MENKRFKKPIGKTVTAHDPDPASSHEDDSTRKQANRGSRISGSRRKSKAAVTISPGVSSTRDVWLDKA